MGVSDVALQVTLDPRGLRPKQMSADREEAKGCCWPSGTATEARAEGHWFLCDESFSGLCNATCMAAV